MSKLLSMLLAAALVAFSGAALSGSTGPISTGIVIAQAQPGGDQDPGSPPDCKKFPKDTRCKDRPK